MLPVNFLFALDFLLMIWRICAIVTEQSHVLNCRMFCILISWSFYLYDVLLFLFSDCRSYAVCGILFRLGMAHFSVSGDSIASHCIFVGIGFEPCTCNNHYLAAFVLPGPAIYFCGKMLCFLSRFFVS